MENGPSKKAHSEVYEKYPFSASRLANRPFLGNVSETPTPTTCPKSTAVHLQFVRQYAPHLYRRTFLASKLRRKGNPVLRLPFVLQYASHLYGSTRPICTAVLLEKYWGLGSPEHFSFSTDLEAILVAISLALCDIKSLRLEIAAIPVI